MVSSNSSIDWSKFMSESDQKEILESPEFREWLLMLLADDNKTTVVTFTKKDGTTRKMKCTRSMKSIPEEFHPKNNSEDTTGAIRAFDVEKQEWRSFLPQNVQHIAYEF